MAKKDRDIIELAVSVRPATREDFLNADGYALYGVPFWLRRKDGNFDVHPYYFTRDYVTEVDKQRDFKFWLENNQVWVPPGFFEGE